MSKLVRISDEAFLKLNFIAKKTGTSKQDVLDEALENWERDILLKQANEAYAALKKNDALWKEEQKERALWDATLSDGLEDE